MASAVFWVRPVAKRQPSIMSGWCYITLGDWLITIVGVVGDRVPIRSGNVRFGQEVAGIHWVALVT